MRGKRERDHQSASFPARNEQSTAKLPNQTMSPTNPSRTWTCLTDQEAQEGSGTVADTSHHRLLQCMYIWFSSHRSDSRAIFRLPGLSQSQRISGQEPQRRRVTVTRQTCSITPWHPCWWGTCGCGGWRRRRRWCPWSACPAPRPRGSPAAGAGGWCASSWGPCSRSRPAPGPRPSGTPGSLPRTRPPLLPPARSPATFLSAGGGCVRRGTEWNLHIMDQLIRV